MIYKSFKNIENLSDDLCHIITHDGSMTAFGYSDLKQCYKRADEIHGKMIAITKADIIKKGTWLFIFRKNNEYLEGIKLE